MKNLFPVIYTDDVKGSSDFYPKLLGLEPVFEADWYVQLQAASEPTVEIAFVQRTHPSVPQGHQNLPAGVIVTLESDDVDEIHARAESLGSRSCWVCAMKLGDSVTSSLAIRRGCCSTSSS